MRRSVLQGNLTWESGETTWLGPWQGSELIAWASGQPTAARISGLWRKVPLLTRLGVHGMHKQEQLDRGKQVEWKWSHMFSSVAATLRSRGAKHHRLQDECQKWDMSLSSGAMSQGRGVTGPWACSGLQSPYGGKEMLNIRNC